MIVLEPHSRALLILHGLVACALVAASTHHLVWCRGYLGGRFARRRGERRFALITACLFVATFTLGNLLYPTYKVRVRAEYLDAPGAVAAEVEQRQGEATRQGTLRAARPVSDDALDLSWVARLFDVKEHWVALGCAASLLLLVLSRRAHPADDPRLAPLYVGLAAVVCGTTWAGAVIGLLTTSYRSVGSVGALG